MKISQVFVRRVKANLNAEEYEDLKSARISEQNEDPKESIQSIGVILAQTCKEFRCPVSSADVRHSVCVQSVPFGWCLDAVGQLEYFVDPVS